eukprot:1472458-Rhodomonas_salina.1
MEDGTGGGGGGGGDEYSSATPLSSPALTAQARPRPLKPSTVQTLNPSKALTPLDPKPTLNPNSP